MIEMPPLTIEYASSTRNLLLQLLVGQEILEFNFSNINTIDLSGIQIIVALVRQANKENREIHFTGRLSDNVQEQLVFGGFTLEPCLTGAQFEAILKAVC